MHMSEILNQLTAPYYLERTSCNTPVNVRRTKAAIKKAFQNQLAARVSKEWAEQAYLAWGGHLLPGGSRMRRKSIS